MQAYQSARSTPGAGPSTLEEAALLALALRERRRRAGNWSGITAEIQLRTGLAGDIHSGWRTAIAILNALVPDPDELLKNLLPHQTGRQSFEWAVHAHLCQPAAISEQLEVFSNLLKGQPLEIQSGLLRSLNLHGRSNLAMALAEKIATDHPAFASLRTQTNLLHLDLTSVVTRAFMLHQLGSLYQVAGNRSQSLTYLHSAESTLKHWLAGLYLQELNLTPSGEGQELRGEDRTSLLLSAGRRLQDEVGVALAGHPGMENVVKLLTDDGGDPMLLLIRAGQLNGQGEVLLARNLASQGVKRLVERVNQIGLPFWGDFIYDWQPEYFLQILTDLDLADEALSLVNALLTARPTDSQLIDKASQLYEKAGQDEKALEMAQADVTLEPLNPNWHRRLGALWVKSGDWQPAYDEMEEVMRLVDTPLLQDRLSLAQAALLNGALQRAVDVCERILEDAPANGEAASLEGQALAAQGDTEKAMSFLNRATLNLPENPAPWLILSQIYQEKGQAQRALETLRSAAQSISEHAPAAADLYLALGEACLELNLESEALPALKKAVNLSPGSTQIAYLYGKTLLKDGQVQLARKVLESTRSAWEDRSEMAFEYALAAHANRDMQGMLSALETSLRPGRHNASEPERIPLRWYLLYARLLLNDLNGLDGDITQLLSEEVRYNRAERVLKEILERDEQNYEARFFMGLISLGRAEYEKALAAFEELAEIHTIPEPELLWRVQWGLGQAAMQLNQGEMALAALKEASQTRPNCLDLQRDLAEACRTANLKQEALMVAENVLRLAPDQVGNLTWYARFIGTLGERRQAMSTLETAVQLAPDIPNLRILLAEWQLDLGDGLAAQASLQSVSMMQLVSSVDLRHASELFLRMEEKETALKFLEKALEIEAASPSLSLLYDVARLQQELGKNEAALTTIQKALGDPIRSQQVEHISLYLLQTDLLASLNRVQAGLASLGKALCIAEERIQADPESSESINLPLCEIHERFSILLSQSNQLAEALYHAEKALDLHPESLVLRYRAADLAFSMLQINYAEKIANQPSVQDSLLLKPKPEGPMLTTLSEAEIDFLCLRAEIALERASDLSSYASNAGQLVDMGLHQSPLHPRLLAVKARCQARQGDVAGAGDAFTQSLNAWAYENPDGKFALWLGEAALEAQQWADALRLTEGYTRQHPGESRAHLALARALVTAAERQWLCQSLDSRAHAPGADALSDASHQLFEEAVQTAARLSKNQADIPLEIQSWQVRGRVIFNPSMQTAREEADLINSARHSSPAQVASLVASLVAMLRLLKRAAGGIQAAQAHLDDPHVALQVALCHLDDPHSKEALDLGRRLIQDQPDNPLHHVLLARAAAQEGLLAEALASYENALRWWPSEAAWHDAAGDTAYQLQEELAWMMHREQSVALDPTNVAYALKLGEASLQVENISRAVEVLEMASRQRPDETNVWLALSAAYQQADRLQEALEAALQAAHLSPDSGRSYLLAGETALAMQLPDQAVEYARKAVIRDPEDATALLFLSCVLAGAERYGEALEVLESCPSFVRNTFQVAFERARLVQRFHGSQAALEPLEKLAVDYPEEPDLLTFLAYVHAENGNLAAAERHAFKSLRLNPNQPELSYILGCWQHKAGQLDHAVNLLGEAIRLAPERLDAYLELGAVYQERRENHFALQTYREAIRVSSADHRAYYQCGLLLRNSKDYPGAEAMLRRAADLAPKDSAIRRQLVAVIALNLVHNKQEVNSLS